MAKDRGGGECMFQGLERGLAVSIPNKRRVLPGKKKEVTNNIRVFVDEATVKVCEAEKGLYVLYISWGGPRLDGVEFFGVHMDARGRDYKSQIPYDFGVEGAFRNFRM